MKKKIVGVILGCLLIGSMLFTACDMDQYIPFINPTLADQLEQLKSKQSISQNGRQFEPWTFDTTGVNSYNFRVLGNRLAVGRRTLDPLGKVRILLPQPFWKHSELLYEKKSLIPALKQLLDTCI